MLRPRGQELEPPASAGRSVRVSDTAVALKTPSFLSTQRRVQWNPQERRVEQDALKHDAMLASLRASFSWHASSTLTTPEWRSAPKRLPDVLDKISAAKEAAALQREAVLHEQDVRRLRQSLRKPSRHPHPRGWDKSKHVSHYLNETLWRHPDPTPNPPPNLNFRPVCQLQPGQPAWTPNSEFPQASQVRPVSIYGSPVRVPSGTFRKFGTTAPFQGMVRPAVSGQVRRIEAHLHQIPDDGTTASVQTYKEGVQRDLAEMQRVWERVRPRGRPRRPTLKAVAQFIISMNRMKRAVLAAARDPALDDSPLPRAPRSRSPPPDDLEV